jgi:L-asparagine transporter-like permease
MLGKPFSALLSRFEFWLASAKLTAVVGFVVLLAQHLAHAAPASRAVPLLTPWTVSSQQAAQVFSGVVIALFSLAGAEVGLTAPRALISLRVLAAYMVPIALILTVIRTDALVPGFSPFTLALDTINHDWAARCLDLLILLGVLKVSNIALATSARVLGSGNPEGLTGRSRTAASAVAALCVASHWPSHGYAFLVESAGVLLVIVYILFVLAVNRLNPVVSTPSSGRRPWFSYILITFLALAVQSMAWVPGLGMPLVTAFSIVVLATFVSGFSLCRSSQGH